MTLVRIFIANYFVLCESLKKSVGNSSLTGQSPEELHREREELKKTLIRKVTWLEHHTSDFLPSLYNSFL